MTQRVSVGEAGARFSELAQAVSAGSEPMVIEQDGRPLVVLVPAERWEAMERARELAWQTVDSVRARNAHVDPDEVLAEVTAAVEAVRQEMYEERRRADAGRS